MPATKVGRKNNLTGIKLNKPDTQQVSMRGIMARNVIWTIINQNVSMGLGGLALLWVLDELVRGRLVPGPLPMTSTGEGPGGHHLHYPCNEL